jgi:antirestriction protein ArdC
MSTTNSQFEQINALFLEALGQLGLLAWRQKYRTMQERGLPTVPINAAAQAAYRGINIPLLWMAAEGTDREQAA